MDVAWGTGWRRPACCAFVAVLIGLLLTPSSYAASPWDGEWEGQLVQQRMACSPCKLRLTVQDGVASIRGEVSMPRLGIDGAGQVTGSLSLSSPDFNAECSLTGQATGNTLTARGRCIGMAEAPQLTLNRVSSTTSSGSLRSDPRSPFSGGPSSGGKAGDQVGGRADSIGADLNRTPRGGQIREIDRSSSGASKKGADSNGGDIGGAPMQLPGIPLFQGQISSNMKAVLPAVVEIRARGALGSGFVIDAVAGLILTNAHVIGAAQSVTVRFAGEGDVTGTVLRRNAQRDVALIQVQRQGLRALPIRLSEVNLVEKAYAVGSPLGLSQTVSEGIISSLRTRDGQPFIQSTAAISPGNSGGPLLDASGNVIGISTLFMSGGQNLNFFIPIGSALSTLNIRPAGR